MTSSIHKYGAYYAADSAHYLSDPYFHYSTEISTLYWRPMSFIGSI